MLTRPLVKLFALCPLCLGGALVHAESTYSIKPRLFDSQFVTEDSSEIKEARLQSGLGLAVKNKLLDVSLDYNVEGLLKEEEGSIDENTFQQKLGASLRSNMLNDLLGLDARLSADSTVTQGGDGYRYRIVPGFSKSIEDLADISFRYEYELDKASAASQEKEKLGYAMGLKGQSRDGRLTWKGDYVSSDHFEGGLVQTQSTELLKFQSRYQLVKDLHLELSSAVKDETLFAGGLENDIYTEKRYGAGLSWSPSRHYSLAFKVNKLDESRYDQQEVYGSGTVSWFPQRNLEFSLSYGDHLVEGGRGVMLNTRINLGES